MAAAKNFEPVNELVVHQLQGNPLHWAQTVSQQGRSTINHPSRVVAVAAQLQADQDHAAFAATEPAIRMRPRRQTEYGRGPATR